MQNDREIIDTTITKEVIDKANYYLNKYSSKKVALEVIFDIRNYIMLNTIDFTYMTLNELNNIEKYIKSVEEDKYYS